MAKKKVGEKTDASSAGGMELKVVGVDLGDASKIIDANVIQRVYGDAISKPLKEASGIATDVLKGLRCFTLPFLLAAHYKDRLMADLAKARSNVPPERQVESPPEIAGPIIASLRFIDDTNPLREMFLNLLSTSIDSARQQQIHPAFPMILSQLSSDEVKLLALNTSIQTRGKMVDDAFVRTGATAPKGSKLAFPDRINIYVDHLEQLTLIRDEMQQHPRMMQGVPTYSSSGEYAGSCVGLSEFGRMFMAACAAPTPAQGTKPPVKKP